MNNEELKKAFSHMLWADKEVWEVVLANLPSKNDDKIRRLLFHSHFTQQAFLKVWKGEEFELLKDEDFTDINSVKSFYEQLSGELAEYISKINTTILDNDIDIPWSKYFARESGQPPTPVSLRDTITQVAMHSTYHRAQINTRLRELDVEPPMVDYIVWLWAGQPK